MNGAVPVLRKLENRSRRMLRPRSRLSAFQRARRAKRLGLYAIYARVLDGENLWLAVVDEEKRGATLALRNVETGSLVRLSTELERRPDQVVLSGCSTLYGVGGVLVPRELDDYGVVVLDEGSNDDGPTGFRDVVVAESFLKSAGPTTTPPTRDRRWRFDVHAEPHANLRISCQELSLSAQVEYLATTDDAFVIGCTVPAESDDIQPELLLMSDNGETLARRPLARRGAHYVGTVAAQDVPLEAGTGELLYVGMGSTVIPLRRRANDLKHAGPAVQLPALHGDRSDEPGPILRLVYRRDGGLAVRRPEVAGDPS